MSGNERTGTGADASAIPVRQGLRLLLGPASTRKFVLVALGSMVVSAFEIVGLLLIIPLVQLVSSTGDTTGFVATLEDWLGNPSRSRLTLIMASAVMIAFVLKAVFTTLFRWWATGFVFDEEAATTAELLDRYMHAPYWIHLERNTAEFLRTLNESIAGAYSNFIMAGIGFMTELVVAIAIVIVLIVVQPIAALSVVVYFAIAGFLYTRLIARRSTEAGRVLNEQAIEAFKASHQALGSVKEVTISQRQEHFVSTYRDARITMAKAKRTSAFLGEFPKYVLEVIFIVGVGILSVTIVARSTSQDVLALLALFIAAGFRLLPSLVRMMASYSAMRIGRKGFDLVVADLAAFPADGSRDRDFDPAEITFEQELSVEDLSFTYRASETPVLRGVSFTVRCGESLGIVGLSGAGKSTLVDILLGLHIPTSGTVRVDGVDILSNLPGWQRRIGLVPQDVYLLDESFVANIAFGIPRDEVDERALDAAIDRAQLRSFIDSLPDGVDTIVGERGTRLSGGQRQRIGIARSLYSDPTLLILDEATSALDNRTEAQIASTIESLHGDLTMIVVAHRLSTIRNCDRILFLVDGEVEGIGTFDELRDQHPDFSELVRLADTASDPVERPTF